MKLEKENEKLKRKLKELEEHLRYMPDGEGYLEAKADFESHLK
jgi:cell division protein FtsB